jgi:hypothetical protein
MSGNIIYRHKLMVNYALLFFSKVVLGVKEYLSVINKETLYKTSFISTFSKE